MPLGIFLLRLRCCSPRQLSPFFPVRLLSTTGSPSAPHDPVAAARNQKVHEDLAQKFGIVADEKTNVSAGILEKVGRNLLHQKNHPLCTIKNDIYKCLQNGASTPFKMFDSLSPFVTVEQNFDALLVPKDHVSRRAHDTYYANATTVLRTHTSAHQCPLMASGETAFLVAGDVYRRDEIDASHYPVFHQMEGVRLFSKEELVKAGAMGPNEELMDQSNIEYGVTLPNNVIQKSHHPGAAKYVEEDLKKTLVNMVNGLIRPFDPNLQFRWVDAYFPFTHPSWELEINFQGNWMEVLGSGIIQQKIIPMGGEPKIGWAFGLGLERLAMVLFGVPDIRLFWSTDERFLDQFNSGKIVKFAPYSKYPSCIKDVSFFIPEHFHENDFYEIVRSVGGDLIENVKLIDSFKTKAGKVSHCYRILYRSMDRNLTNKEINVLHDQIRAKSSETLSIELR